MKTSKDTTIVFSSALRRLLNDHQIFCTAGCCKAQAFQLSEDSMSRWLTWERIDRSQEIAAEIERIKASLEDVQGDIVLAASGLESRWNVSEFRAFWEHFAAAYIVGMGAHQKNLPRSHTASGPDVSG